MCDRTTKCSTERQEALAVFFKIQDGNKLISFDWPIYYLAHWSTRLHMNHFTAYTHSLCQVK